MEWTRRSVLGPFCERSETDLREKDDNFVPHRQRDIVTPWDPDGAKNVLHCRELIIWGADIEVQDQDGRSALSVAVTCDSEAAAKLVTLLLDNGANPNLCDRDNMTPLLIAAFEG